MRIHRIGGRFCPPTVDTEYCWHLMPMDRLDKLQTFLNGGLWLARLDTFGPIKKTREGELPLPNLGLLDKMPKFMVAWVEKQYHLAVMRSYASCWSKDGHTPNDDLWNSSFGGYGNGVAIGTTPEEVSIAIAAITSSSGPAYFGSVRYIDHYTDTIPEGNTLEAAFVVRHDYCAENEARVLVHSYGQNAVRYLLNNSGPHGPLISPVPPNQSSSGEREFVGGHSDGRAIVIRIERERFIRKIVFGSRVSVADRNRVTNLISDHGLASRILS